MITICPAFEKWLLAAAKTANVNPSDYQMPNNPKDLKKRTRKDILEKDESYRKFFQAIQKASPPDFWLMNDWLKRLKKLGYENQ